MEKIFQVIEEKLESLEISNNAKDYEIKRLKEELRQKEEVIKTQACILEGMRMQKGETK